MNQAGLDALGMTLEQWQAKLDESVMDSRRASWPQVDALLDAGWRFELPEIVNHNPPEHDWRGIESEPWQWYWRAPAKRKRGKGRRYLSTNQAFSALKRCAPPNDL